MEKTTKSESPNDEPKRRYAGGVGISIHYQGLQEQVVSWEKGSDVVFSRKIDTTPIEVGVPLRYDGPVFLDAYAVRDDFEAADAEVSVRRFLNGSGPFWPFGDVRLSQFREWQAFFKLIRRDDFLQLARTDPQAQEAHKALCNFPNEFFHFDHPDDTAELERVQGANPQFMSSFANARNWRIDQIHSLLDYLDHPAAFVHACYTPEAIVKMTRDGAFDAKWSAYPFRPPTPEELMPLFVFKPKNVVEAIAATISADRLQRVAHRVCEGCGNLFLRGNTLQRYCKHPGCKEKARTKRRTNLSRSFRDSYLTKRKAGHDALAIEKMAIAEGQKITAAIRREMERAEKALARKTRH
jgi:hypothetical protein